jgi:hypothetical protein
MVDGRIILASWLVLIAVWFAMARGVKTVAEHEAAFSTLSHYAALAVGMFLVAGPSFRSMFASCRSPCGRPAWRRAWPNHLRDRGSLAGM